MTKQPVDALREDSIGPAKPHSTGEIVGIRPATAADQATIRGIVRAANLNPLSLGWQRFVIAEAGGRVIGVGQVRPHSDGSRELASIAVVPTWQGRGVGTRMVARLLCQEPGEVYAMCRPALVSYYAHFGFRPVAPAEMSAYYRRIHRGVALLAKLNAWLGRAPHSVAILRRPAGAPDPVTPQ